MNRKIIIAILFCLGVLALFFQGKRQERQLKTRECNFIAGYMLETAKSASAISGIPAPLIIAMAILESGWRTSPASQKYFSLFGWTDSPDWQGKVGRNGDGVCRAYDSLTESVLDHIRSLEKYPRYDRCFKISGLSNKATCKMWAQCLQDSGYCCGKHGPNGYAKKLIRIMDQYNLYDYE